jgi:hypothetical protein
VPAYLFRTEFSLHAFPSTQEPIEASEGLCTSWAKALKDAGLQYFCLNDFRHTVASGLTVAGVSALRTFSFDFAARRP